MTVKSIREANESPLTQAAGSTATRTYTYDTSANGTPTNPAVQVYATSDLSTSVKATVMPAGSPSVTDDIITLPPLTALTAGVSYRVDITYTIGANVYIDYFIVNAER